MRFIPHIVILALAVAMIPASAQVSGVSIDDIDETYVQGDKIVITGSVTLITGLEQVTLKVSRGTTVVTLAQLDIARDGTFATILNTDGGVWESGTHIITVTYQADTSVNKGFELKSNVSAEDLYTLDIGDGETGDIGYTISGGSVSEMEINQDLLSLVVRISPVKAGSITLDINREYLDAKSTVCGGDDVDYIVLIDNVQVPYRNVETDMSEIRKIEVAFEADESKIEVIGTCVIPEFGAVALVVLAVATTGVIIASRKMPV